ncbi:MAG: alanine racemase, partial [Acutalibacteraceae bacterium]
ESLSLFAQKSQKQIKVHIKVDTGMSRIGFDIGDNALEDIVKISALPNIIIEGMFTHFATADCKDKTFAKEQFARFIDFNTRLKKRGVNIECLHCANSAAIMEMKETHLNAVRSGIITYGLYPSDEVDMTSLYLLPAMELKSHISYIKTLEKGVSIGYGATFVTERKTVVATIPVGYADGYPRCLSNVGEVLIRGKRAKIIGRVCMDQFMVDVTDIKNVSVMDTVTLIGRDGIDFLSVEEVSEKAHSFNYEFVCDISKRVPRVYYKNGEIVKIKELV